MNAGKGFFRVCAVAVGFAAAPVFATGGDDGDSFRELSAQWWQWAHSIPAGANPLLDTTGAKCMVGQRGPLWFLAGATTGSPTARSCTVPQGTTLFFPVLNYSWINTTECGEPVYTIAEMRALVAPEIAGATGLAVVLDGVPLTGFRRVRSEAFSSVFPKRNLYGAECIVAGKPYRSVDDGYYMKLRGLTAGTHVLNIRGTSLTGFVVDVTYTLNVVPTGLRDND